MRIHRCPWCGENLPEKSVTINAVIQNSIIALWLLFAIGSLRSTLIPMILLAIPVLGLRRKGKCGHCQKQYHQGNQFLLIAVAITLIWSIISFASVTYTVIPLFIYPILLLGLRVWEGSIIPMERELRPRESVPLQKYVKVELTFTSMPYSTFLSRFLFYSEDIMLIVLQDEAGHDSVAMPMVFVDLRHIHNKIQSDATFVQEDTPVELLRSGRTFIMFYENEPIGLGKILSNPELLS